MDLGNSTPCKGIEEPLLSEGPGAVYGPSDLRQIGEFNASEERQKSADKKVELTPVKI